MGDIDVNREHFRRQMSLRELEASLLSLEVTSDNNDVTRGHFRRHYYQ